MTRRQNWLFQALMFEVASLLWIAVEAILGGFAASQSGSVSLSAFSVDSAVEWIAAAVMFVRLWTELRFGTERVSERAERVASGIIGSGLLLLSIYIAFKSGQAFAVRAPLTISKLGFTVAIASSVITPVIAIAKRRLGHRLHSHALLADAACGIICAYTSWTLLLGLILQRVFGWWWADALAALGILYFVLQESLESLVAARTGAPHVHTH